MKTILKIPAVFILMSFPSCFFSGIGSHEPSRNDPFILKVVNTTLTQVTVSLEISGYDTNDAGIDAAHPDGSIGIVITMKMQPSEVISIHLEGTSSGDSYKLPNYGVFNIFKTCFYDSGNTLLTTFQYEGFWCSGNPDHPYFTPSAERPFYLELDATDDSLAHLYITGVQ